MLPYMHVFMQVFVLVERISKETAAMGADPWRSGIVLNAESVSFCGRSGCSEFDFGAVSSWQWVNLASGAVEDDRVIMGGECKFKKVKTGRDNDPKDRVFMLKFNGNPKPLMFWIRDAPTAASSSTWPATMVSPDLSSGIFALPMLLIQLGPTALGLHMVSSMHYTTVEEELLALEPTMMEPTSNNTFGMDSYTIWIISGPYGTQDSSVTRSRTGAAAATACSLPTSRLEFAIQVIDQLIHRL
eukprot:gene30793-35011_t